MASPSEHAELARKLAAEGRWHSLLEETAGVRQAIDAAASTNQAEAALELAFILGQAALEVGDKSVMDDVLEVLHRATAAAAGLRDTTLLRKAKTHAALLLLARGRGEEAREELATVLALIEGTASPEPSELSAVHARLAHVCAFALRRPADAVPHYRFLHDAAEGGPAPMLRIRKYVLGYCLAHAGLSKDAIDLVEDALRGAPAGPWRDELGALLEALRSGESLPLWDGVPLR